MLKSPEERDFRKWLEMFELAHDTNSTGSLLNALNILDQYGDDWEDVERTEVIIYSVDVDKRDIQAAVNWNNADGTKQHGGLSFELSGANVDGSSLYRWVTRQ